MFFSKKTITKEQVDVELEIYRKERILQLEKELFEEEQKVSEIIIDLHKQCAQDIKQIEHDYHYSSELKGIELEKLEAKIESLELVVKARNEVILADQNCYNNMKKEIERLNNIILKLIEHQHKNIS